MLKPESVSSSLPEKIVVKLRGTVCFTWETIVTWNTKEQRCGFVDVTSRVRMTGYEQILVFCAPHPDYLVVQRLSLTFLSLTFPRQCVWCIHHPQSMIRLGFSGLSFVLQLEKRVEELSRQLVKEKQHNRRDKLTVAHLQREVARQKSEGPLVSFLSLSPVPVAVRIAALAEWPLHVMSWTRNFNDELAASFECIDLTPTKRSWADVTTRFLLILSWPEDVHQTFFCA